MELSFKTSLKERDHQIALLEQKSSKPKIEKFPSRKADAVSEKS